MPVGILFVLLDLALVAHAAKTGRFSPWGYVIIMLPGLGAAAYILVELLPEWLGSYKGQRATTRIAATLNPTRRYNALHEELAIVDTLANRGALAQECLSLRKFDEALAQYDAIIANPLGDEPFYFVGKARAEYGLGRNADAVATLDALKGKWPDYQSADAHLLYAMALEDSGRNEDALASYADVARYFPGAEPRIRQAKLLQKLGRNDEAGALAADVVRTLNRAPKHVRQNQREWLNEAKRIALGAR